MARNKPKSRNRVKDSHAKVKRKAKGLRAGLPPTDRVVQQRVVGRRQAKGRNQAEQALLEAHMALELAMEGISKLDDRGQYLFVNTQYAALLGYRPEELVGQSWEVTVHPDDRGPVLAVFKQMLAVGRAEVEIRGVKKDGNLIYKHVVLVKPDGPEGKMPGHFCFVRDITQRKREDALQRAEKQALELVAKGDGLNEVLAFVCRTIEIHTAPMLCAVMLVTEDGMHLTSAAAPSLPDDYNRAVDGIPIGPTIGSCGSAAYFQKPAIVSDIATHPLWENYAPVAMAHGLKACWSQPIISHSGDLLGTFAAYYREPRSPQPSDLNIVERASHIAALAIEHLKVTEALRESEARFQAFMAHSPAVSFIKDSVGRHLYINPTFERLFGVSLSELRGKTLDGRLPPEVVAQLQANDAQVLTSGQPIEVEETVPTPDGKSQHWLVLKFPLTSSSGERLLGGEAIDITARKQAEAALRQAHEELEQRVVERTAALRLSEQRYAGLVNSADGIIMEVDEAYRITFVSQQAERILGYPVEQWLDDPMFWINHLHPDDLRWAPTYCQDMTKQGLNHEFEYRMFASDGRIVWIRDSVSVMRDDDGRIKLSCILLDVTKHKDTVDRLRLTQYAVDHASDQIFAIGPDGYFRDVNESACRRLGYSKEELLKMSVMDIDPDFPKEAWGECWARVVRSGQLRLETRHRSKSGEIYPVEVVANYLCHEGQELDYAIVRDISERKRNEAALLESEERFSKAFNESAIGMAIVAPDWRWLQVNQALCEIVGYSKAELETSTFPAITHPDDLEENLRQAQLVLSGALRAYQMEKRYIHKDGSVVWVALNVSLVRNIDGTPKHFISQIQDITERKQIEDRLLATQYAVDHAADQILVIGPSGNFLDVNEAACRRLGYTKDELLTMFVMDIDPDYSREVWPQHWEEFRQAGQLRLETSHRSKSGEIYPVEVTANYHLHNGQELDYAIVRDITERRRAEAAIRDSELRYKLLTEATFDGIAIHDEGILLEVNVGLERMFGYEPRELVGRSIWDLIAEESQDFVRANMKNGVNGPYEAMGRRKDGSTFPGEVVVRPYRYYGKDVRLVAGRDITERKHLEMERSRHTAELERQVVERTAEIAKLESQRAQTERLAALGRLAAGVAHEINNPIAGIKNAFALVKQAVDHAHPQYEFVGLVDREIARVSSIVQNMYQLYRRESGRVETVDLRTMIGDIEALFTKQLQQRQLRLVIEAAPGLNRLDVPRSDLLQVLLNLLNNAIDCSPEKTVIRLTIREEGEFIQILVADQGPGISPEVLPHIFDPFFTTKMEGDQKGMGLGLSISQSLVTAMGGEIDVHTQLGHGSTFSVLLPRHRVVAGLPNQTRTIKEVMTHGC